MTQGQGNRLLDPTAESLLQAFAMPRSRGGIFHSFCACLKTRNNSLIALSSVGQCPRVHTARRSLAFSASMALVTGMKITVPRSGWNS